jgi:hypothetical protein
VSSSQKATEPSHLPPPKSETQSGTHCASLIEADFLLAETSDGLDAAGQDRIRDLKEDFSKVSDLQTQALDSGDLTKLKEVCPMYEDILRQIESLNN